MIWRLSHRAHPVARAIADRHYNRQNVGAAQFVPPGRCLVLLAPSALWVTSWPFAEYVRHRWGGAWVNSLFRREGGAVRASDLIRQAVAATRWYAANRPSWSVQPEPALGMVTFVDPDKVKHKRDPGRCYLRAGFERDGETEGGLLAFRMRPERMPAPVAPIASQLWIGEAA